MGKSQLSVALPFSHGPRFVDLIWVRFIPYNHNHKLQTSINLSLQYGSFLIIIVL